MKRDRTVASGSTIEGGGAILISPSRVQETGSGTELPKCDRRRGRSDCGRFGIHRAGNLSDQPQRALCDCRGQHGLIGERRSLAGRYNQRKGVVLLSYGWRQRAHLQCVDGRSAVGRRPAITCAPNKDGPLTLNLSGIVLGAI